MIKIKGILLFLFLLSWTSAQTVFLSDDFEDGNKDGWKANNDTQWVASSVSPISGVYSLKHHVSGVSGHSFIRHALTGMDVNTNVIRWRFNLKNGNFDPSTSNKFWAYLFVHDTTQVDGYALGVNLTGGSDSLSLWKLTNSVADGLILTTAFDWNANTLVGIEVTRDTSGVWEVKYDTNGGFDNLQIAGAAKNKDYTAANYFALSYYFKTTEAGMFWMDDVLIQTGDKVSANIAAYLQGPFAADTMRTTLLNDGYLPLSQPFLSSPWNYSGKEVVTAIPDSVVDWILVQLRTGTDSASTVATRAGFITKHGKIVDMDGLSPLSFAGFALGDYYVVIRHRNHLPVMTAAAQALTQSSVEYDFSTAANKAYGTDAMKDLGSGVFGFYTGDANGNKQIQNDDKNDHWNVQVGSAGYKGADFNLNGQVQNDDKNDYWNANVGRGTQVPF